MIETLLSIIGVATAALLVLPSAGDSFESPKRLAWAVLAVLLSTVACIGRGRVRDCAANGRTAIISIALLAWMAVRTVFIGIPQSAWTPLATWALPILLFAVVSRFDWDDKKRRAVFCAVACIGVFEAAVMLLQRFGFDPFFGVTTRSIEYLPGRMIGTIGYQNQAAEFLGIALAAGIGAIRGRWPKIVFGALIVATIVLTANRGAMLALCVVAAARGISPMVEGFRKRSIAFERKFALVTVALVALAIAAVALVPEARSRVGDLARPSRSHAVQSRYWMGRVALSLWRDNPIAGVGAGEYAYQYIDRLGRLVPEERRYAIVPHLVYAREAHCDPLQFGAEFGIAGVLLVAALAVSAWPGLRREARYALLFAFACSCFNFTFQTAMAGPLLGFIAGMALEKRGDAPCASCGQWRSLVVLAATLTAAIPLAGEVASECADKDGWAKRVIAGDEVPWWMGGKAEAEIAARIDVAGRPDVAGMLFEDVEDCYVSPLVLQNHGHALAAAGRWKEAAAVYSRLADSWPMHNAALRDFSIVCERGGDIEGAVRHERSRCIDYSDTFTDAEFFRLVALALRIGDLDCSKRFLYQFQRRCMSSDVAAWTPEWDNLAGAVELRMGNREGARECFARALERKPGLESARRNLDALDARR